MISNKLKLVLPDLQVSLSLKISFHFSTLFHVSILGLSHWQELYSHMLTFLGCSSAKFQSTHMFPQGRCSVKHHSEIQMIIFIVSVSGKTIVDWISDACFFPQCSVSELRVHLTVGGTPVSVGQAATTSQSSLCACGTSIKTCKLGLSGLEGNSRDDRGALFLRCSLHLWFCRYRRPFGGCQWFHLWSVSGELGCDCEEV